MIVIVHLDNMASPRDSTSHFVGNIFGVDSLLDWRESYVYKLDFPFNHQPNTPMNEPNLTQIKDTTANPAPLGLLGFGMTTVLLNLHNAGFFELNSMILAMGICYGGLAQVIAGSMEWKKGNTFAATAFLSYGLFWLSFVTLIILPKSGLGRGVR